MLFFVSGATALICEVVWTRWLTTVMGSASAATAIVLAVFMAGLGIGSWLAAKWADRAIHPIRVYAFMELAIATFVLLPGWETRWLTGAFEFLASWSGPLSLPLGIARVVLAIAAVGPPTLLMGASLPVVVTAMSCSGDTLGRRMASAYAANSFGGVVGTVLAGFFLIEMFGLQGTALTASCLAVAVSALAFVIARGRSLAAISGSAAPNKRRAGQSTETGGTDAGRRQRHAAREAPHSCDTGMATRRAAVVCILLAAAVTGFCALGFEVIWSRVLSVLTLNTTYAFTLMLAVMLCGLSVGSWMIHSRLDRLRDLAAWFVTIQILLSAYALSSVLWAPSLVDLANWIAPAGDENLLASWFARPLTMAVCLMLVPATFMGASLPIACKLYASVSRGIARPVGYVYAANTFGSVAGALTIGLAVIPSIGTWWATVLCTVAGTAAALAVLWSTQPHDLARHPTRERRSPRGTNHRRRAILTTAAGAMLVFTLLLGIGYEDTFALHGGLTAEEHLIFRTEDEYGLVEVAEDELTGTRWMLTNRLHWEGSTLPRAVAEQRRQGLLPLVLHRSPQRVLEIGVGTGIKLSALDLPVVNDAVAVEISPGVLEASRLFADSNHGVTSAASNVEVVCADGRHFVALTPQRFDVIVNGLLTPYRSGVSRLYSVEHFRNCRAKLAPEGMFVVWVAIRQIAPDDLKVLVRTLLEVFPETTMWLDGYYAALVSTKAPLVLDADEIVRRCGDEAHMQALDEAGISSPVALLATFVAGPEMLAAYAGDQPLNTEDRPIIEFRTPRTGDRLNTEDLAAEMIGTLSLLQEPLLPTHVTATGELRDRLLRAQQARWIARQALVEKCYGHHLAAAGLFRDALSVDPTDELARSELELYLIAHGKQCVERGLLNQARATFAQAVRLNPRSISALASLATLEKAVGNDVEAEELWQRASSLAPGGESLRRRVAEMNRIDVAQRRQ